MGSCDLRKLELVAQALSEEAIRIDALRVRLEQISEEERRKRTLSNEGNASFFSVSERVREAVDVLGQEAAFFHQAASKLQTTISFYRRSEQRIIEIYQGEYRVVPRTRFGRSDFENLQKFERIMPIRAGGRRTTAGLAMTDDENGDIGIVQALGKIL